MTKAAKRPLILVSEDYDPRAWGERDAGESEFESWAAVVQDLWGTGCFAPGQASNLARAANAVTIKHGHVVGAIGGALGPLAPVAAERAVAIDAFDCDRDMLAFKREQPQPSGRGKLVHQSWNPARPELKAGHYDSLIAARAFTFVARPDPLCQTLAAAIKAGGLLFVDELYAADMLVAALVARTTALPDQKRYLHGYDAVTQGLADGGLELRSTATTTEQLLAEVKAGLARGEQLADFLTTIPEPFRRQRLTALRDELERAAGLSHALDRGLITAIRTLHRKPPPA
jgi:hypothetical protein